MSITFHCPECGKSFTLGDQFAGKKGKCKQCGAIMAIPAASPSPSRRPDRETSPSRSAPVADLYGLDDVPMPARSGPSALEDDEFAAPAGRTPLYPKRPGLYPESSRSSKGGGGTNSAKIVVRVVLWVVGGLAGLVASALGIPGLRSMVTPGGWSSRSQIETFIKRQVDLTNELTGILRTVTDIPTATATSSRANATVKKLTENLRSNKDRKGNQKDIDALKNKYLPDQRQALQDFTGEIMRIAMIPGAFEALAVQDSLQELARIEETIPGLNNQAGFTPPRAAPGNFPAPGAPAAPPAPVSDDGTPPGPPGMFGPGPRGPNIRPPGFPGPPAMPPRPNFPAPRGRVRPGFPGPG